MILCQPAFSSQLPPEVMPRLQLHQESGLWFRWFVSEPWVPRGIKKNRDPEKYSIKILLRSHGGDITSRPATASVTEREVCFETPLKQIRGKVKSSKCACSRETAIEIPHV